MDDISSQCVQLKGLPVRGTDRSTVKELLDETIFRGSYLLIDKHVEREDDVRWLVLFKSKEAAERCIKGGPWTSRSHEDLNVFPDYCSACIVPNEWQEYCVENSDEPGARREIEEEDDDSFSIIPEERSDSVDSNDLFLSGGKSEAKTTVLEDSKDGFSDMDNIPRKDLSAYNVVDGMRPEVVKSELTGMISSVDMIQRDSCHSSGNLSVKSADLFGSGTFKHSSKEEHVSLEQEPGTTDGQAPTSTDSTLSAEHYQNSPHMAKTEAEPATDVLEQAGRQSGDTPTGHTGQQSDQMACRQEQSTGEFGETVCLSGRSLEAVQSTGQYPGQSGQYPSYPHMPYRMGMNNPGYSQHPYMQEHMQALQKHGGQMFYPHMPAPYAMPQNQFAVPQNQYAAPQNQYAAPQNRYAAPMMFVPCTYDAQGKLVPIMPTGTPHSPTSMQGPQYSEVQNPEHVYTSVKSAETPYMYMSRHPSREPVPDNNVAEPVYNSIRDSLLDPQKAPPLPPRNPASSQTNKTQSERSETSMALDSAKGFDKKGASNLKIFDETGNSLDSKDDEEEDEGVEEAVKAKEGCCKIKVTGISRSISRETLELFFESRKRSGGGDIASVDMKIDKGEAIIEFSEPEVVQQVLEKHSSSKFVLTGSKLDVEIYDPQIDKHKVFVSGLAKGTSQESLQLFFEARCHHTSTAVVYGETPGTALLSFDSEPDIKLLQDECNRKRLDDKFLEVCEVEVSSSVKVTGCPGNMSNDTITFYFENKRRSQGGPVKGVEFQERTGAYIVTFVDAEDAVNVCRQKGHSLNLTEIIVRQYYPCLDLASSYVFTVPSTIELTDMGKYMIKFLLNNKLYNELFTVKLQERYGRVLWPKTSDDYIKISCTVDKNDIEGSCKVENWSERCLAEVQGVLDRLRMDESFTIAKEAWKMFKDRLQEVTIAEPDKVAVYLNQQVQGMVVVGEDFIVQDICGQARNLANELEQLLDAEQQSITKTKKVKKFQIILLVAAKFLDKYKKSSVTIEMSHDTGDVTFKGPRTDVDTALEKMMQSINSFAKKTIPGFRKLSSDLLFTNETRSYIKKQMMDKRVTGIWDVNRHHMLELYSKSEADLEVAEKVLTACVIQRAISLEPRLYKITQSQQWSQTILNLKQTRQNLFQVEVKPSEVFVVGVNFCFQEVIDEIMKLFDLHSVVTEFMSVDPGKFRFISTHKESNIKAIEGQFSKLNVEIRKVDRVDGKGFKVTGNKDGCTLAIQKMKNILDTVQHKDIVLNHPNIVEFVNSQEGRYTLSDIEKCSNCKLEIANAVSNSNAPFTPKLKVKCRLGPNAVGVTEGDMTNMLVDGIVNPTNERTENMSGLSASIINKGGHGIQKECDDIRRRSRSFITGSVIVTQPGRLPCKGIIHVVMPEYKAGLKNEIKLKHAVEQCLEHADKQGYKTLVMPLLGFGKNKYPLQLAVQWMLEALADNLKVAGKFENVRKIFICDIRQEVVSGIISGMKKTLGKDNEVKEYKEEKDSAYSSMTSYSRSTESEEGGAVGGVASETSGKMQASVVVGELVKQKVDVIVNSASPDLNLNYGNVAKAILRAGGDEIQDEIRKNYPGGLKLGQLAVTSGGRMSCRYVFHGILISWDEGQGNSEKHMKSLVNLCLKEADRRNKTSIAFPSLGTGNLGYPVEFVAQLMFDTVSKYQRDNPSTSLTKVLFVIWHGDENSVKAFQKVELTVKSKTKDFQSDAPTYENLSDTFSQKRVRTNSKFIKTFDGLTVEIVQGDITQEKSEIIVNSILRDLNLNSGNVSRAILKAAGSGIQTECSASGNQSLMDREGIVVTTAGNMVYCQKIYHIESKTSDAEWTKIVLTCLEKADKDGFTSISFPALGTGGKGCSPESMTKAMFEAFKQYTQASKGRNCRKQVRIVIFLPEMVSKFVDAAQDRPKSRKSMMPFRSKKKNPMEDRLTIYIYGDSSMYIGKAIQLLENLYASEDVGVSRSEFKSLDGSMKKDLERAVSKHGVEIKFDSAEKSITLYGYEKARGRAKRDVYTYLSSLKPPTQPERQDTYSSPGTQQARVTSAYPELVQLRSSDREYINVASKFLNETGTIYQIVQIEKLQNQYVTNKFVRKRQQMEQASQAQVGAHKLWFSCDNVTDVSTISNTGFSVTLQKKNLTLGYGFYFAKSALNAVSSAQQMDAYGYRHIYLAEVLTGDYCQGHSGINQPPLKSAYSSTRYDSTTDSVFNPLRFAIFDGAQACPLYHVVFK